MAYINSAEIEDKLRIAMKKHSALFESKAIEKTNNLGDRFVSLMEGVMHQSLSGAEIAAVGDISRGSATVISNTGSKVQCQVDIDIASTSRPSLQPETYGSANDMAALFNNGVDHVMGSISGLWHGKVIKNRQVILPTHFVQDSVDIFNAGPGAAQHAEARLVNSGRFH